MKDNKYRVVIDTNIFIYGWFGDHPACDKILDLVDNREIQLLFSQETIGELVYITKNFAQHNLQSSSDQIAALQLIMILFHHGLSVNTLYVDSPSLHDPQDEKFLKCALKGKADFLITDDFKHGMKDIGSIKIVSSDEFIRIYECSRFNHVVS